MLLSPLEPTPEQLEQRRNFLVAAMQNRATLCGKLFGQVGPSTNSLNTKVLNVAAQNKSYEAFEAMIDVAEKNISVTPTPYSILQTEDWDELYEVAETDVRLFRALDRYHTKYREESDKYFKKLDLDLG
jgi:hypothetical protein